MELEKSAYFINIDRSITGPEHLIGKRLAILADFHDREPESVLNILRSEMPDAIMIPGDLVVGYFPEGGAYIIDRCRNVIRFLESCCRIAPTYMSVGNHECLLCCDEYDRLRMTGVKVLNNEWVEPSEGILIGGLTSAYAISYNRFRDDYNRQSGTEKYVRYPHHKRPKDIRKHPTDSKWIDAFEKADGYKILLSHHPEYWSMREPMLRDRKIDLVVSGHAHGGQWRLMGRGIYSPGQGLFPQYTNGIHQGPYGSMIVSRGLSNPYKTVPRLGNPCEVVYVQFV